MNFNGSTISADQVAPPPQATPTPTAPNITTPTPQGNVQVTRQADTPLAAGSSDKPQISVHAGKTEVGLPLTSKDTELQAKLDKVWELTNEFITQKLGGSDPRIRTFTGRSNEEIVVAIYYLDAHGTEKTVALPPGDPFLRDLLKIKDEMREFHRKTIGSPSQNEPFKGLFIPNHQNGLKAFESKGRLEKINKFIADEKLNIPLPQVRGRIVAGYIWAATALPKIEGKLREKQAEIGRLAQSSQRGDRQKLNDERKKLQELETLYRFLLEFQGQISSDRPLTLSLNWVLGLNETLNDFERARVTQKGLEKAFYEEEKVLANEVLWLKGRKRGPTLREEDRIEYAHSAAGLSLYQDENLYVRWCDSANRTMKADCFERLFVEHVLTAVQNGIAPDNPHLKGTPLLCIDELKSIFQEAATEAKKAYELELTANSP